MSAENEYRMICPVFRSRASICCRRLSSSARWMMPRFTPPISMSAAPRVKPLTLVIRDLAFDAGQSTGSKVQCIHDHTAACEEFQRPGTPQRPKLHEQLRQWISSQCSFKVAHYSHTPNRLRPAAAWMQFNVGPNTRQLSPSWVT